MFLFGWMGICGCLQSPVQDSSHIDVGDPPGSEEDSIIDGEPIEFTAVAWNLESGGSTLSGVSEFIPAIEGEALWGFCEAESSWAGTLATLAADEEQPGFSYILGTTGWDDRLVIAWDEDYFEKLDDFELDEINLGGNVRAPLVARFRIRNNGTEFLFMVNHLWRSDEDLRHEQAQLLNEWAADQSLPVIAMGDYNFDWRVSDDGHDIGYDYMVEDEEWTWIRPDPLERTQCSNYNSVLDFAFVTPTVLQWEPSSTILTPDPNWCPNDETRSDHRPVSITVTVPPS